MHQATKAPFVLFLRYLCLIVLLGCSPLSHVSTQPVNNTSELKCALCNQMVNDIFDEFRNGMGNKELSVIIGQRCEALNIFNFKVCNGTASIIMPTIRFMYDNSLLVQGNLCAIYLQTDNCSMSDPDKLEWKVNASSVSKPPITTLSPPPPGSPTIKVLHIADVHWDPEYLAGSNAACGDLVCCRASSGNVVNITDAAGYWGDYRYCDLPWYTIEKAVAHMAETHSDAAYIIWTGDLAPHNIWSTNKEDNIEVIERLMSLIQKYFPSTPVYPTLGNHEAHPSDTFAPPDITDDTFNTQWLYDVAAQQWARWLPAEVSSTIRYGGYYTVVIQPGLRVVSMNTNYCYTGNWWTLYRSQDPASSLIWLTKVLEDAERAGEKVHILSHIPPGNNDCWTIFTFSAVNIPKSSIDLNQQ